jgi:hypothetical protein
VNPAAWAYLLTSAAGLITAVGAVFHSRQTRQQLNQHLINWYKRPPSPPH